MWYKINVYNKPHTDGLSTVIRIICDIRLIFIINHTLTTDNSNTYYMWYKNNVYNKPHTDGMTTVIRIICDIRLMFIINHTLTDWQR